MVSVEAANLLLHLQKGKKKLGNYLCESGYKPDEVEAGVQKMISARLLHSQSEGSDLILELASEFEAGPLLDLSQQEANIEVKAME